MGPDCWSQLSFEKRSLCHNQAMNKTQELWQYNEQFPKDIRPWIRCIFRHQQIKQLIMKAHNSLLHIISIIHKISLWQQADAKRPFSSNISQLFFFESLWAAFQLLIHPLIAKLLVPSVGSPCCLQDWWWECHQWHLAFFLIIRRHSIGLDNHVPTYFICELVYFFPGYEVITVRKDPDVSCVSYSHPYKGDDDIWVPVHHGASPVL